MLRVAPGGRILEEIETGERNCYASALGGADERTLFLCVTPADFNPDVRRANPLSAVLSTRVDVAPA